MKTKILTLLNTSVLTAYGTFEFKPLTLAEAQETVRQAGEVRSAVGHAATAEILSDLLEFPVPVNRLEYAQTNDDTALIFKLKMRVTEGRILSREEIEAVGYDFGLLTKIG